MWVCLQDFHTPKNGSSEAEYEDAYSPDACFHRGIDGFRCAVADGASESAFSREWAQLLVRNFARRRLRLRHLQDIWEKLVKLRPLPWYLEAKVDKGAHAAFVGLSIRDGEHQSWRALAIGDSCLFQVRDSQMLLAAPIDKAEEFNNSPHLLSTKCPAPISANAPHLVVLDGTGSRRTPSTWPPMPWPSGCCPKKRPAVRRGPCSPSWARMPRASPSTAWS